MTTHNLEFQSKEDLKQRFTFPVDLKFYDLSVNITTNGAVDGKLGQSTYRVVDRDNNVADISFDVNLFDDDIKNTDLEYQLVGVKRSTLDYNREEYVDEILFKGSITIS